MNTDPVLALADLEFGYAPQQTIISINQFEIWNPAQAVSQSAAPI